MEAMIKVAVNKAQSKLFDIFNHPLLQRTTTMSNLKLTIYQVDTQQDKVCFKVYRFKLLLLTTSTGCTKKRIQTC